MGNGTSISNASLDNRRAEWSIPSWCIGGDEVKVTPEISGLVQDSWARVMHSNSDAFILAHANEPSLTPLTFFYDKFYSHLFDWCPEIKPMFKRGIRQQGQMLANVIKFIVDNIGINEKEFKENLTILAKVHNGRGITANHYSVMGMTLIHTIRFCVGETLFTEEHRHAWIVVYSRMMIVMIPVVVSGETIASDYLVKKAEVDEARASQSSAPGRKSAWNQDQVDSKCPGNRKGSNSDFSTCPVSRKGSTQLKPPKFANDVEIKSSPSSHTTSVLGKMLVHKPSSIMSSRSSVSSICAMATSKSDTEEL